MIYKLLAIDADGTLLDNDRKISGENLAAIRKASESGVIISMCSGRSCKSLKMIMDELAPSGTSYIISFNGGEIHEYPSMKLLYQTKMNRQDALSVVALSEESGLNITPMGYITNDLFFTDDLTPERKLYLEISKVGCLVANDIKDAIREDIAKLLFIEETSRLRKLFVFLQNKLPDGVNMYFSDKNLLEITPEEAEKGKGLTRLTEMLGIPIENTLGIGDNMNDLSLIKTAGLGAAVANAEEELKDAAGYITYNTNNSSAVAEVIRKFIL